MHPTGMHSCFSINQVSRCKREGMGEKSTKLVCGFIQLIDVIVTLSLLTKVSKMRKQIFFLLKNGITTGTERAGCSKNEQFSGNIPLFYCPNAESTYSNNDQQCSNSAAYQCNCNEK